MVLELFFIIPYLSSRAMKSQQEKQTREQAYAEALKRYQARLEKLMSEGKTQEEAEQILLEERQRRYERLQQLMENGMSQEEALQVLAEERRQQECAEKEKEAAEGSCSSAAPELLETQDEDSTDEEEEEELYAMMVGRKVNSEGCVVDRKTGIVLGHIVEGKLKRVVGKKVRAHGEIYNSKGKRIGRAEPVLGHIEPQKEDNVLSSPNEKSKQESENNSKEAIKDVKVVDQDTSESPKSEKSDKVVTEIHATHAKDSINSDSHAIDRRHAAGQQAQMIGPALDERSPKVSRSGNNVLDKDVTLDSPGNHEHNAKLPVGNALQDSERKRELDLEEHKSSRRIDELLSEQIHAMAKPALAKVKTVLDSIPEVIVKEETKDPQEAVVLVNQVMPAIVQATSLLKDILEKMGRLDPTVYQTVSAQKFKGHALSSPSPEQRNIVNTIANNIDREEEASPSEWSLADLLACLAENGVSTIENAKTRLKSTMPFAVEQLDPSWYELESVLLQITAFIGLLLPSVLGIAGNLLHSRGHGFVIRLLLGGLGLGLNLH